MSRRTPSPGAPRAVILFRQEEDAPRSPEDADWIFMYCLMRTDLESMNPGKAVAQGIHAGHKMTYLARRSKDDSLKAMLDAWEEQAAGQGFGTTITLSVDERKMREAVEMASFAGLHAGIVTDPSYPLRDGAVTHEIVLDTCAFLFGPKYLAEAVLHRMGLMP